ncbi:unnamed protein product [Diabrotica balteata]|uniref:Glycoside hydrolase family 38 central domain-containing protein n=1 Tax=Diabrotica balteata TaxID=107213 RepID=A0A9P0E1E0_DIABA|nr:unnamed protein product [Diabrotica balteata]
MICGDEQIVDDFDSIYYNLDEKVNRFSAALDEYVKLYSEDNRNILVTMGGDFQYQQASYIFDNIDRLIKGFKNHKKYNLIYSTPSCYLKSIHDSKVNLTLKTDDFFPYSSDEHSFWTGYFSSRPTLKRFERVGHNILQATKQMYALSSTRRHDEKLTDLNQAMGTLQHHNAITGTQKTHVTSDYIRTLTAAITKVEEPVTEILSELLDAKTKLDWSLSSCVLTNVSICSTSQKSDKFVVAVYNPLAWNITHYVRLPVEEGQYIINGPDGKEEYDLIEPLSSFSFVKIKDEHPSAFELIFAAKNVEPLGLKIYHIEKQNTKVEQDNEDPSQLTVFKLNEKTNLLHNVTLNDITLKVKQNFFIYKSGIETADNNIVRSGAYVFRPTEDKPEELTDVTLVKTYIGTFVEEVIQKWTSDSADIYQAIRWYKNENHVELDWLVGNINIKDNVGKEIVSRFEVIDFNNKNIFYTDSNGRETIQRIKDKRGDYSYDSTKEPVASNYYPVTSKIVVKDEDKNIQVAVLTDRSQGGTSLETNQIELMVHRRTITDDGMGVGEPLSETEFDSEIGMYARGSHYLVIGDTKKVNKYGTTATGQERILAHKKLLQPWIGLSSTKQTFDELEKSINLKYSAINEELPENINILTLEPWISDNVLLRFEHIMEKGEDPKLSTKAIFKLKNLIKGIDAHTITETTLGANVPLTELHDEPRYVWNIKNETSKGVSLVIRNIGANGELSLNPMQIRTFIVSRKSNNSSKNMAPFTLFIFLVLSKMFFM